VIVLFSAIYTDCNLGMRVEWAVGRARVDRWSEEIILRLEEMRRTLISLLHTSRVWEGRRKVRSGMPLSVCRGLDAYAARQSAIYEGIAQSFYKSWEPVIKKLGLTIEWPSELSSSSLTASYHGIVDDAALEVNTELRADITLDATDGSDDNAMVGSSGVANGDETTNTDSDCEGEDEGSLVPEAGVLAPKGAIVSVVDFDVDNN
jgi:hypothetical protein